MTRAFVGEAIGVENAILAEIATAMTNGYGLYPILTAVVIATGTKITAVAVLLINWLNRAVSMYNPAIIASGPKSSSAVINVSLKN